MKVLITRKIPQPAIDYLVENNMQVEVYEKDEAMPRRVLLEKIAEVDGLVSLLSDDVDRELMYRAGNLKIVANYAVGYNNIDVAYARSKGIAVSNTPDVLTDATADLTWALILSVSKRIVEADRFVREGKFNGWGPLMFLGGDVTGKTIGIVGLGRIGKAVAERAAGFGMKILYVDSKEREAFNKRTGAQRVELRRLFSESDFISFHCPLTPETRHLLNAESVKTLKKGAFLINTSRGPVLDETVLVKALSDGTLAGAGLDVYEFEPDIHEELLKRNNVVLLPHIGSATLSTRTRMGLIASENVVAVLNGNPPVTPV